jgi:hypothetical protein
VALDEPNGYGKPTLYYPLIQGLLLAHFVSTGRAICCLHNTVLLLVGTGHPAARFGRLEVFLCGTLTAYDSGRAETAMVQTAVRVEQARENNAKT